MATNKPRLTITLEPGHHEVVSDVAKLRGVSKSTIVTEMLGASIPALERVAKLLRALQAAQSGGYVEDFAKNLDEAEKTLAPLLAAALEQMDLPMPAEPPPSNTGVTPSDTGSTSGAGKGLKRPNHAASRQAEGGGMADDV